MVTVRLASVLSIRVELNEIASCRSQSGPIRSGVDRMQSFPTLLAYFGPEVQLPLLSMLGAVSGILLMVGRAPIRLVKRWIGALRRR